MPGRKLLALGAFTLLASACGTTVPLSAQSGLSGGGGTSQGGAAQSGGIGPAGSGAGGASQASLGSYGGAAGSAGATGSGAASASGGGATTGGNGPAGASGSGAIARSIAAPGSTGRGFDAHSVYIGIVTQNDIYGLAREYGVSPNDNPGDTNAMANAVAADINSHGGILGRQVKLLFDDVGTVAAQENNSTVAQSVCAYFTQDHPVVAVWNFSTQLDQGPTLRGCMAQAKVPMFTAAARAIDDQEMASLEPYYYHSIMVSWDRLAPVLIARLKAQGWFTPWNTVLGQPASGPTASPPKVGILVDGTPEGGHVASVLEDQLAKAGYPGAVSFAYSDPAQGQSASSFYFKANGVTHVIVTDVEMTAFQNSAAGEHYYPRYGITTYNDPYSNLESSGLTPTGTNNGAMGVGWVPALDVSQTNDPGLTPGGAHCLQVMTKAGQNVGGPLRLAEAYAFSICDSLYLIARGAQAGGGFTAADIFAGIMRIGPTFSPANGFATALTPSQPYVQGAVRDLSWDSTCSCMKYGAAITKL